MPTIFGAGRITLDAIVRTSTPEVALAQAGGTCGNVAIDLAWLGWGASVLMDFGDDRAGEMLRDDLERFGVSTDLIAFRGDISSPVIVHHVDDAVSPAKHSYSSRCHRCGARLRYYEPVPLADVVARQGRIPPHEVCFYDRDSEGTIHLGRRSREAGALVVYEPNYAGPESDLAGALATCHVFKVADEKLHDLTESHPLSGPGLVIETLGARGLRYRDRRHGAGEWRHVPAFVVPAVRDAGGSGDWCTAGVLAKLAGGGVRSFMDATEAEVFEAMRFGQALAAWNCGFVGARGGMYAVGEETFAEQVSRILAGEAVDPMREAHAATMREARGYCGACGK